MICALFFHDNQALTPPVASPPPQWEEVHLEELQLREKLHRMTDNISDHSFTSDEEEDHRLKSSQAWRTPPGNTRLSRIPSRPTSRASRLEEELNQLTESHQVQEVLTHKHTHTLILGLDWIE